MTHADRDGSERELSAYLAADKAEPAPHADRVNAYAEAMCAAYTPDTMYDFDAQARAVIALADRERATLLAKIAELKAEAKVLIGDRDATLGALNIMGRRAEAAEAKVTELEAEVERLRNFDGRNELRWTVAILKRRSENAERALAHTEDALADERAKVAKALILAQPIAWERDPQVTFKALLRGVLAGPAEPEASETGDGA